MKAADSPQATPKPRRFRSLRSKVLLPFFLLITALCGSAIWGSFHLADTSFKNSADERLVATQKVLFREFKRQEQILQTYAVIMQQFQSLTDRFQNESELGILQDRLFNTLEDLDISTAIYPIDIRGLIQQESLIALFEQVRRSDQARFRYSNEFNDVPVLMVAAPLHDKGKITKVLLLRTEMGEAFLRNVTSSLNVDVSLMTIDGEVMAQSSKDVTSHILTPAQINLLGNGHPLYLDDDTGKAPERHLYSIIPLGSSDMILIALEASLEGKTDIHNTTILRMIMVMIFVIITGTIFYFRRVSVITRPAKDLYNATEAIGRGNLNYRIQDISDDELGQIAVSFNQMAADLEKLIPSASESRYHNST